MEINFIKIEQKLGYTFSNLFLLKQAFTRRSYSENSDCENNQVLEFIGDKSIDVSVIQLLTRKYGSLSNKGFKVFLDESYDSKHREGILSKIKQELVQKKYLSKRIDDFGFSKYLLMGSSELSDVKTNESAKEDLFEAIVGAITIDCAFDFKIITPIVSKMLDFENYIINDFTNTNYVGLVQEYFAKELIMPEFDYAEDNYGFKCKLLSSIDDITFNGFGKSKKDAKYDCCHKIYNHLNQSGKIKSKLNEQLDDITIDNVLDKMNHLIQQNIIETPICEFEPFDCDKNYWLCTLKSNKYEDINFIKSSKTLAKKFCCFVYLILNLKEKGLIENTDELIDLLSNEDQSNLPNFHHFEFEGDFGFVTFNRICETKYPFIPMLNSFVCVKTDHYNLIICDVKRMNNGNDNIIIKFPYEALNTILGVAKQKGGKMCCANLKKIKNGGKLGEKGIEVDTIDGIVNSKYLNAKIGDTIKPVGAYICSILRWMGVADYVKQDNKRFLILKDEVIMDDNKEVINKAIDELYAKYSKDSNKNVNFAQIKAYIDEHDLPQNVYDELIAKFVDEGFNVYYEEDFDNDIDEDFLDLDFNQPEIPEIEDNVVEDFDVADEIVSEETSEEDELDNIIHGNNYLITANPEVYDHYSSFHKNGFIDWAVNLKLNVGDTIFIYESKPVQKLKYVCRVEETNMKASEAYDDRLYWNDMNAYKERMKKDKIARLRILKYTYIDLRFLQQLGIVNFSNSHKLTIEQTRKLLDEINS